MLASWNILWAPISHITVPAKHCNAGSVKYVMGPDLTHSRARQPQQCWLREVSYKPDLIIIIIIIIIIIMFYSYTPVYKQITNQL